MGIVLGSYSCYYAIVRGRGENERRRIVSVVKGGNDRKRSNKRKRDGDEEASHNTMKEVLFSIPLFQSSKNEDQVK